MAAAVHIRDGIITVLNAKGLNGFFIESYVKHGVAQHDALVPLENSTVFTHLYQIEEAIARDINQVGEVARNVALFLHCRPIELVLGDGDFGQQH